MCGKSTKVAVAVGVEDDLLDALDARHHSWVLRIPRRASLQAVSDIYASRDDDLIGIVTLGSSIDGRKVRRSDECSQGPLNGLRFGGARMEPPGEASLPGTD